MIVLDANILIRAVLGKRVRQLIEAYSEYGIRFYAPEVSYADAEKHLPALLNKRRKSDTDVPAALTYLQFLIEPIGQDAYGLFEAEARQRLRNRDEEDWRVLATALSLSCAIWTEDTDFFGAGVADFRSGRNLPERTIQAPRPRRDSAIRKKRDIRSNHQLQRS